MTSLDKTKIQEGVRLVLQGIGEDPEREGLRATPSRVAHMYEELMAGASKNPSELFESAFDEGHKEMVLVKDITFYSLCEHHLLPFFGVAHIAYIPSEEGKIFGLSKLSRLLDLFSKRLQLQERLTTEVADTLVEQLSPQGVLVVLEAEHLCMSMRGVRKPQARTMTSAVRGVFETQSATRTEALSLIRS